MWGGAPLNRNIALLADFPSSSSFSAPCCFLYVSVSWQLGPPQPSVAKDTAQSYAVSNSRPRANRRGRPDKPSESPSVHPSRARGDLPGKEGKPC